MRRLSSVTVRAAAEVFIILSLVCPVMNIAGRDSASASARPRFGVPRFPDVSRTHITFVFAGELWLVPREGGAATALTHESDPKGSPKFSPDGRTIAFTGGHNGIYTVPVAGGTVARLTHHPSATDLCDWTPDGAALLFMTDAFFFAGNFDGQGRLRQLFAVPATGGLPTKLPVPYGANGAISPDGEWLAYTLQAEGRHEHIKHYQGGLAPDIWLFNLRDHQSRTITDWAGADTAPMWHGETIYYLSDEGGEGRRNIWSYALKSGRRRQLTHFTDYDVNWPSVGPGASGGGEIVFVNGADLYLLDLSTNESRRVDISLPQDRVDSGSRTVGVSDSVTNWATSPDGRRIAAEARGDIWRLAADGGAPLNLTRTSGAAERYPAWSPDDRWIAYFSDAGGEYQLFVAPADGSGPARQLSRLGAGFRYQPVWSPDSRLIAFSDSSGAIYLSDVEKAETKQIRQDTLVRQPQLRWSPDSSWLVFPGSENGVQSLWLYEVGTGAAHRVTGGGYSDKWPTFDRDGDYVFFVSDRNFDPLTYDSVDYSKFVYPSTELVMALPLRRDLGPPWRPSDKSEPPKNPLVIDFEDVERRAVVVASDKGRYSNLTVARDGRLLYTFTPAEGFCRACSPVPAIKMVDFNEWRKSGKGEPKTVLSGAGDYQLTADGQNLLVRNNDSIAVLDVAPDQKLNKAISLSGMTVAVEPRAEWRQIFNEAWRIYRDFFYDPAMRGVDWPAARDKYAGLLHACANRDDLDYVIGEMLGELGSSHVYLYPPPGKWQPPESVGMLGVDFGMDHGAYRIVKIYDGSPADAEARNPLRQPGVNVKEGDYLLAVNGRPLDTKLDPWAAFTGLAEKDVTLTLSRKPALDREAREVVVRPGSLDYFYRHRAWVESNRAYVERKSGGRVGYLYFPVTSEYGFREFTRQFGPQLGREALIIDSRWDFGGHIPYHLIDLLSRRAYFYGVDLRRGVGNYGYVQRGPKCVLVNGVTMSGGDFLSYLVQQSGVARLVGTRTMGAAVGAGGVYIPFIDGGFSLPPTIGLYDADGKPIVEGRGVEPDVRVLDDPALMANGGDPQLDAALRLMMNDLRKQPRAQTISLR